MRAIGLWKDHNITVFGATFLLVLEQTFQAFGQTQPIRIVSPPSRRRHSSVNALLTAFIARNQQGFMWHPDFLRWRRVPQDQRGLNDTQRYANLHNSLEVNPRFWAEQSRHECVLFDDVMTSGATFLSMTTALQAPGLVRAVCLAQSRQHRTIPEQFFKKNG